MNEKPDERLREDLCASQHGNSWWLDVGYATSPKIARVPWSDQWWRAILFGKEKSTATVDAVENNAAVSGQAASGDHAVSDKDVSDEAASGSEPAFDRLKPSTTLQMLYDKANHVKAAGRHRAENKDSLKATKMSQKIFENPGLNSRKTVKSA